MLLIDDRSGSNELIPLLAGDDTISCRLDSGDVAIPGNGPAGDIMVGVEVKKINDLLSSIATGRLQATQLPKLLVDYQEVWLLLVGDYRPGPTGTLQVERGSRWSGHCIGNREVPYSYVEGFLIECGTLGVHHKRVESNREAAWWIRSLEHWWGKPWDKHKAMRKFDTSGTAPLIGNPHDPEYQRRMAIAEVIKGLPSIGFERAWAASLVFHSIQDAINATAKEWAEVDGVGKVIAQKIVEVIHGYK